MNTCRVSHDACCPATAIVGDDGLTLPRTGLPVGRGGQEGRHVRVYLRSFTEVPRRLGFSEIRPFHIREAEEAQARGLPRTAGMIRCTGGGSVPALFRGDSGERERKSRAPVNPLLLTRNQHPVNPSSPIQAKNGPK